MIILTNRSLNRSLSRANSYQEWLEAAQAYDQHNGLDRWRRVDHSDQYDYVSIRTRLDRLRALKARHDIKGLLYTLNEGIHGNMGGMGKAGLYGRAKSGTKHLIADYIDEIVHTLELLADDQSGDIDDDEKLDFFHRANHCYGHSALMMSGSGSLLFFHVGVVRALAEAKLLPSILSGSSGGALVGAMVSTHTDEELVEKLCPEFFLETASPTGRALSGAPVDELEEGIKRVVPDLSFQQAFTRTGRALNVSIAPAETHQTSRLLNAITSPSVLVRSGILASAAVPGIFPPVTLQALDSQGQRMSYLPSRRWVDGSVSDDLPAKRLARLYGVNHYIVSQTNPHVLPFVSDGHRQKNITGLVSEAARRSTRAWFNVATEVAGKMDRNGGMVARTAGLLRSVVNQDYVGDINILPDYRFPNPLRLFSYPGDQQVRKLITSGERCTWPKLEMIRLQTRISRKLVKILAEQENRQQAA